MRRSFLAAVFCALFWPATAHALSCAPLHVDSARVARAAAIFEGVATAPPPREDAAIEPGVAAAMDKDALFTFLVSKSWKGVTEGETVTVRRNLYWGDGFRTGQAYLVFAEGRDRDGVLVAGLCGPTVAAEHADSLRETLQKLQESVQTPSQDAE
jgi:hypothetical protein